MPMHPGWNPASRNRHVGTKAHGHGANNTHVIPESYHTLTRFYEVLDRYVPVPRQVGAHQIQFLVEPTRPGWFYPCTVDDVCAVLRCLPGEDIRTFRLVVLRQPTRKQRILSPVWGRAIFSFDIDEYSGAAIVLEAQTLEPIKWSSRLAPDNLRELERLCSDGHRIEKTKRRVIIHPNHIALRNTVLYRTLLHEVGHHVDARDLSDDQWDSKPHLTKEDFAHRYAATQLEGLLTTTRAPLDVILDDDSLERERLSREWFYPG